MSGDPALPKCQAAETIFNAALELKAEERSAWLAEACGKNVALRERVEALLRANAGSTRFLPEIPAAASFETLPATRVIGDYELLEEIARGGMGVVYRARQRSLDRIVAVKMILAGQFASREQALRFRAEAEAAARLQHPNIVRIHDTGEHEGWPYFSMDYVAGPNLGALVREKPLPARRAAACVKTIAGAIHYAHEQGVLHRDLKPSNILIDASDQPHITDFGLAKRVTQESFLTVTGEVMGSPGFMPPEQAGVKLGKAGCPSDVYALGGILFYLVTGHAPFVAETVAETLQQVLHVEPVSPRLLNASVPQDLATICLKCLEKQPVKRYPTARALADELGRFLNNEPIRARTPNRVERVWRWCRRHPAVASLTTLVVLLFLLVAVGASVAAWRINLQNIEVRKARNETTEQLRTALVAQARANRLSGRAGRRFDTLDVIANAVALDPTPGQRVALRNEAIACLALEDLRPGRRYLTGETNMERIVFDASGELYAARVGNNEIRVARAADRTEVSRLHLEGNTFLQWFMRFSADGRHLFAQSWQGHRCVWDVMHGKLIARRHVAMPTNEYVIFGWSGDFTPNSQSILWPNPDGTISGFRFNTGTEFTLAEASDPLRYLVTDPSGTRALCFSPFGTAIEIRDLSTGRRLRHWALPTQCQPGPTWSGDGRWIAMPCENGRVYVCDAASGALRATVEAYGLVRAVAFNHTTTLLATALSDGTVRLWEPSSGREIVSHPGHSVQLQFAQNGSQLAYLFDRESVGALEVAQHPCYRRLDAINSIGADYASSLSFHRNGRLVAVAVSDKIRLWDALYGRELAEITEPEVISVLIHPNGGSLIASGRKGLHRWPLICDDNPALLTIRIGSRESLVPKGEFYSASLSADGRILAVGDLRQGGALIVDLESGKRPYHAQARDGANSRYVGVSPNGRWVAGDKSTSGGVAGVSGVVVWDAQTGQVITNLPGADPAMPAFSSDNQWLAIVDRRVRLWKTESWVPGPMLEETGNGVRNLQYKRFAFSPDVTLIATTTETEIQLHETKTGRRFAALDAPRADPIHRMAFSSDGTHLFALRGMHGDIEIWNLRQIRSELAARQLDWDLPPYPNTSDAPASSAPPLRISFVEENTVRTRVFPQ